MRHFYITLGFLLYFVSTSFGCSDYKLANSIDMDVGGASFAWEFDKRAEFITIQMSILSDHEVSYLGIGFGTGMTNTVRTWCRFM